MPKTIIRYAPSTMRRLFALAVLLAAAPAGAQTHSVPLVSDSAASGAVSDRCAPAQTGRGPAAVWVGINDSTAGEGRALTEMTRDRSPDRFALCVAANAARNVEASVRFRAVGGQVEQVAGLAVRVIDAGTYYVVRADARAGNVRLYRVAGGAATQIGGRDVSVTPDDWHNLRLRAVGDAFQVGLDGAQLFEARDGAIREAGRIGVWIKSDSATHFERLMVSVLD
jgi:hypothetical protein